MRQGGVYSQGRSLRHLKGGQCVAALCDFPDAMIAVESIGSTKGRRVSLGASQPRQSLIL
jgi:hypothetical protein